MFFMHIKFWVEGSGAGHLPSPDWSLWGGGGALFGSQFQITVHHFKETRVARNWKQVFTEHPQSRAGSTDLEA